MEKSQIVTGEGETVFELVDATELSEAVQSGELISDRSDYNGKLAGLIPSSCVYIKTDETPCGDLEHAKPEAKIYLWQHQEVVALLELIDKNYDVVNYTKKHLMWKNISEELSQRNFPIDTGTCYRKWRNLIRSYKAVNQNREIGKNTKFQYYDQVHNILMKIYKNNKTPDRKISSVRPTITKRTSPEQMKIDKCFTLSNGMTHEEQSDVVITYLEKVSRTTQTSFPEAKQVSERKFAKTKKQVRSLLKIIEMQQKYLERDRLMQRQRNLDLRREGLAKERRFQETIALKREQMELEKKKIQLLERYVALKTKQL